MRPPQAFQVTGTVARLRYDASKTGNARNTAENDRPNLKNRPQNTAKMSVRGIVNAMKWLNSL